MGGRSTIKSLPDPIKAELDRLLKEDKLTIDQVVSHLKTLGADVSRSALGRYHKRFEDIGRRMRESREVAQVWAERLGQEPQGDIGKLVMELLRTLAFDATLAMSEPGPDGAQVQLDPKAISTLALSIQRLEAAGKWNLEREKTMREAIIANVETQLAKAPRKTDAESLELIRKAIRGEA